MKSFSELWLARTAVGLAVSGGGVRAVRVVRTAGGPRVDGSVSIEFPPDRPPETEEIEDALREVSKTLIKGKTRLVVNVSPQDASLHFFQPPFDKPDKVRRVLRYESEPFFLASVEEMLIDYLPLPSTEDGELHGVVFGAKPEAVARVMDHLAQVGLESDVVLPDRLGLLAAGQHIFQGHSEQRFHLLLDLGAKQTGLALFDRGRPILIRSIYIGGRHLTRSLAEARKLDLTEAETIKRETNLSEGGSSENTDALTKAWQPLLSEIERSLIGVSSDFEDNPPLMVLGGGGSLTPGIDRFLSENLGFNTLFVGECAESGPDRCALFSEMLSPFGLALLALKPGYCPNLRQGEFAPMEVLHRYRIALGLLAAGLLAILLINLGGLYYSYRVESQKYQAVKSEIDRVFREIMPGVTTVVAPLAQLRQEIEGAGGQALGFNTDGGRVLDLLLEVSRVTGAHESVRITDLALNPQGLELSGEGESFEIIDQLKTKLGELPYFSETTLGGARVDPSTQVLTFKISLKRKAG